MWPNYSSNMSERQIKGSSLSVFFQVFVFDVGGKTWKSYNWSVVTTLAMFGKYDAELVCYAHSKGARVVLKGTFLPLIFCLSSSFPNIWSWIERWTLVFFPPICPAAGVRRRPPLVHRGPRKSDGVDKRQGEFSQNSVHGWNQHWHWASSGRGLARVPRFDSPGERDHRGLPQGDPRFSGDGFTLLFSNSHVTIIYYVVPYLGLIRRCLVSELHRQKMLRLRCHRRLLWPAVCHVLRRTESDPGRMHRPSQCPAGADAQRFASDGQLAI